MDTLVEITVYGPEKETNLAVDAAMKEMRRLEGIFNRHDNDSFAREFVNRAGEDPFPVPKEFLELLHEASRLVKKSKGSFDPTIAAILELYAFSSKDPRVPDEDSLKSALELCGWDKLHMDVSQGKAALGQEGMVLDLGGIAKGYIVDAAIEELGSHSVTAALINAGGDLRCLGKKPGGKAFKIGVQNPRTRKEILAVLSIRDLAVATSGDYERYFNAHGKRWHHLLDPKSGKPARKSQSATVVCSTTMAADALATAVFVLGAKKGLALAKSLPTVEAAVVDSQGRFHATRGFQVLLDGGVPR